MILNKFVISLAFLCIFIAISSGFFSTQVLIYGKWPFDRVACQFQGYLGHILAAAYSQTLALLAVNKTRIGFRIGLRIGSNFGSDRTLDRIESDPTGICRIIIFEKKLF